MIPGEKVNFFDKVSNRLTVTLLLAVGYPLICSCFFPIYVFLILPPLSLVIQGLAFKTLLFAYWLCSAGLWLCLLAIVLPFMKNVIPFSDERADIDLKKMTLKGSCDILDETEKLSTSRRSSDTTKGIDKDDEDKVEQSNGEYSYSFKESNPVVHSDDNDDDIDNANKKQSSRRSSYTSKSVDNEDESNDKYSFVEAVIHFHDDDNADQKLSTSRRSSYSSNSIDKVNEGNSNGEYKLCSYNVDHSDDDDYNQNIDKTEDLPIQTTEKENESDKDENVSIRQQLNMAEVSTSSPMSTNTESIVDESCSQTIVTNSTFQQSEKIFCRTQSTISSSETYECSLPSPSADKEENQNKRNTVFIFVKNGEE